MKHKSGTLTNLELGLFNALAVETLLNAYFTGKPIIAGGGVGGRFLASRIVARAGYGKTTSYHYRLLNRLVEYGYLTKNTSGKHSMYSLGVGGFRWLNLNDEAEAALELERQSVANQISKARARVGDMRDMFFGNTPGVDVETLSPLERDDIPF